MKIICTKVEKEQLLDSVCSSCFCPLGNFNCMATECEKCFDEFIEWEVTDENIQRSID